MAATLKAIRSALKTTIAAYYALNNEPIQVYERVPGAVVERAVVVEPGSGTYHAAMGGSGGTDHVLAVHAMVALGDRDAAQDTLDLMISETGTASIKAAIESDRTLGGTVRWADPQGYRDYGTRSFGDATYLMATLDIAVLAQ